MFGFGFPGGSDPQVNREPGVQEAEAAPKGWWVEAKEAQVSLQQNIKPAHRIHGAWIYAPKV